MSHHSHTALPDGAPLRAPDDGFIVFPNPNALPGNEWFYFARRSTRRLGAQEHGR